MSERQAANDESASTTSAFWRRFAPSARFAGFLLVSSVAAIANFTARILFSLWLPYALAVVLAFFVGLGTAFLLNRRYVFRDAANELHQQAFFFFAVNMLGLAQTLCVSLLLAKWLLPLLGLHWHVEELAHAVGIAAPTITSYLGHKHYSFRSRG
ncbi:MAG: GtrA family protein [Dokdonella sp.]